MGIWLIVAATLVQLSGAFPVAGFAFQFPPGKSFSYLYTTHVAFNEPDSNQSTRIRGDVGFKLSAKATFTPVWQDAASQLVKLEVSDIKLGSVARPDLVQDPQARNTYPVFFHWQAGKVERVYASEHDSSMSLNFKKGAISLLQLQAESGTRTEIDTSGECTATYKVDGGTIKKTKTSCKNLEIAGQYFNINPLLEVDVKPSLEITYKVENDVIKSVSSSESHVTRLNMKPSLAASVHSQQLLKFESSESYPAPLAAGTLNNAVETISKGKKLGLYVMLLGSDHIAQQCSRGCKTTETVVTKHKEDLASDKIGKASAAKAFLNLVEAFRNSGKDDILATLKHDENVEIIQPLIDALAAAQTSATQDALMEFLDFQEEYYIDNQERYLLAVAMSTHPSEKLLRDLLAVYKKKIPNIKLQESVGEALGAVLKTYCKADDQEKSQVVKEVKQAMLDKLGNCEEENCKPMNIRALGNAQLPDTIPNLVKFITSNVTTEAEAALAALQKFDSKHITEEIKNTLSQIYHQNEKKSDTAIRTKALKILLDNGPTVTELRNIILSTTDQSQHEMATFVKSRLLTMINTNQKLRSTVKEVLRDVEINNYNVLAQRGKSLSFLNNLAETEGLTASYFMYLENSNASIMKRSGMDLFAETNKYSMPLMKFGLFSAGLEGLIGEEPEPGSEDVDATAGISLDLLGVSLRPIEFFRGQSGLMSAVWNAPSALTSALQTTLPLQDHVERVHLQNGLVAELDIMGAVSLDLSGSINISLWYKNAQCLIRNSGAIVVKGSLKVVTPLFKTGMDYIADSDAVIDFRTDVDFSDKIKTCFRMSRPSLLYKHAVTKYESAKGFKKAYTSRISRNIKVSEASFPLPKPNDEQCKALLPSEDDS